MNHLHRWYVYPQRSSWGAQNVCFFLRWHFQFLWPPVFSNGFHVELLYAWLTGNRCVSKWLIALRKYFSLSHRYIKSGQNNDQGYGPECCDTNVKWFCYCAGLEWIHFNCSMSLSCKYRYCACLAYYQALCQVFPSRNLKVINTKLFKSPFQIRKKDWIINCEWRQPFWSFFLIFMSSMYLSPTISQMPEKTRPLVLYST